MQTLSPGKARALQTLSTPDGMFHILAIDHRDSLRVVIDPDNPTSVPAQQLTDIKLAVIGQIAPAASGLLIDPVYGVGQAIGAGVLAGHVGFISAIEEQGYLGDPYARQTTLLTGWGVDKAKRLGASGIKILLFYHPDAGEATELQEQLVHAVINDCRRMDIPLFLEPIAYPLDPNVSPKSEEFARQRRDLVVRSARRLGAFGPDILKLQFPVNTVVETDEGVWREACAELNEATPVPWALLSGGDPFDLFKKQVEISCAAGCSGFMVGRALWREVIAAPDAATRKTILNETVKPRFTELCDIARSSATHGWQSRYALPKVDERWYLTY